MLPRCILHNPVNGSCLQWKESLQIVRDRIKRWQAGDIMGLWSDVLAAERKRARRGIPGPPWGSGPMFWQLSGSVPVEGFLGPQLPPMLYKPPMSDA